RSLAWRTARFTACLIRSSTEARARHAPEQKRARLRFGSKPAPQLAHVTNRTRTEPVPRSVGRPDGTRSSARGQCVAGFGWRKRVGIEPGESAQSVCLSPTPPRRHRELANLFVDPAGPCGSRRGTVEGQPGTWSRLLRTFVSRAHTSREVLRAAED